jgi:hypothetical protein
LTHDNTTETWIVKVNEENNMGEWVSTKERLPRLGERVTIRYESRGAIKERFAVWDHRPPGVVPAFFLGTSWCFLAKRVREWRLEEGEMQGVQHQESGSYEKGKRPYRLTPDGLKKKREAVKEYWRKRREAAHA